MLLRHRARGTAAAAVLLAFTCLCTLCEGTRYNFTFVNPEDIDVVHRHPHLGRHLLDSTAGATPPPPATGVKKVEDEIKQLEKNKTDVAIAATIGSIMLALLLGCMGYCAYRKWCGGGAGGGGRVAGSAFEMSAFNGLKPTKSKKEADKYKYFNDDL